MPPPATPPAIYVDCSDLAKAMLDESPGLRPDGLEVHVGDPDDSQLQRLLKGRRVALSGHTHMPAALLRACPDLRAIVFLGTGASSYVDLAAAADCGIRVRTISGYGDRSVAEHAFGLALAGARRIAEMDRDMRAGRWQPLGGIELAGRTLGVVGLGGIGLETARLGAAVGMNVLGWNRSPVAAEVPGRIVAELDDLIGLSDVLSLHLALTDETRGILSADRLRRMKPAAILVNTARGGLVDEAALVAALREGRLQHAALDVYEEEPLPPRHPLRALDNVTLTAHAGFKTRAANSRLIRCGMEMAHEELQKLV